MKMRWFFLLLAFVLHGANACEVIDDAGQKIKLAHPAQRIISLAPDLTEILFAAGASKHIIGVMQGSDYPEAAKTIPVIANYNSIDVETIVALRPDLIVAWSEESFAEKLKTLGIPVYFSQQKKITDIPDTLKRLGCLAGTEKMANQAAEQFSQRYLLLQKKYSHKKVVSVFYQVWPKPLVTISKASWINDVISLCGGKNIFANLKGAAPEVNLEAVLVANPEVIIGTDTKLDWEKMWSAWPQISAVYNQHLFAINPDWVERAGPRLLVGVDAICRDLELARK